MQIVIDIPDKIYGLLKYFEKAMGLADKKEEEDDVKTALIRAVVNGTPLPKGHGRLFEERDIVNGNYEVIGNRIYELDPIIEADNAESEE